MTFVVQHRQRRQTRQLLRRTVRGPPKLPTGCHLVDEAATPRTTCRTPSKVCSRTPHPPRGRRITPVRPSSVATTITGPAFALAAHALAVAASGRLSTAASSTKSDGDTCSEELPTSAPGQSSAARSLSPASRRTGTGGLGSVATWGHCSAATVEASPWVGVLAVGCWTRGDAGGIGRQAEIANIRAAATEAHAPSLMPVSTSALARAFLDGAASAHSLQDLAACQPVRRRKHRLRIRRGPTCNALGRTLMAR
jgi:hypothetical protein